MSLFNMMNTDPFFDFGFGRPFGMFDTRPMERMLLGDSTMSGNPSNAMTTGNQNNRQLSAGGMGPGWETFARGPRLDVTENDKGYCIKVANLVTFSILADLPGVNKNEVNVHLDDDILTIEGERKSDREEKDKSGRTHLIERNFGQFRRSIRLPADAKADNVKAKMENGVLCMEIAKNPEMKEKTKKIDIK
ncbi:HSP20-like chaperone [Phlyctochytrium arcticum]|nr:HSP20-like chaperone [Phlyctochytrium arcticum]